MFLMLPGNRAKAAEVQSVRQAEVLSVRFLKEHDHMNLVAKHPKLCKYFLENSVYLGFFTPYANKHAPFTLEKNHTVCADSWNCSLQVSLMLLEDRAKPAEVLSVKQAEVLSVRFPKEYDHINLAVKHPKFCTIFLQNSVYLWFFTAYIQKQDPFTFELKL